MAEQDQWSQHHFEDFVHIQNKNKLLAYIAVTLLGSEWCFQPEKNTNLSAHILLHHVKPLHAFKTLNLIFDTNIEKQ